MFQATLETVKIYAIPASQDKVLQWISKGVSNESFMPTDTDKRNFSRDVVWNGAKLKSKFNGSYLKQNRALYTTKKVMNLFIVSELDTWSRVQTLILL